MVTTFQNLSKQEPLVQFYDFHPKQEDFQAAVFQGLNQTPKSIPSQFLYDKRGAELFDQICTLEEYYLTRTEVSILKENATAIAEIINNNTLIEFGSGSSQKIKILLDAAPQLNTYVALDISKQHLYESCTQLAMEYLDLETIAICTDYTQPLTLPAISAIQDQRKIGFFPGSSIGNLRPEEAIVFLKNVATILQTDGGLIIGVDLKKDTHILEPAYDDRKGISAAFAMNLLTRINRELNANFNLNHFRYRAFYDPIGRIEMQLVSLKEQIVRIGKVEIPFKTGESLRTEYSYKYSIEEFQTLAQKAGFQPQTVWTDPQQLFSIHYLTL